MYKIIIYLLLTILIYGNNVNELRVEHGLVLDKNGLFTGTMKRYNMESEVELGVVVDFSFIKNEKRIFHIEVKRNFFWGKGTMNHERLGQLNLVYTRGELKRVEGRNFYENWENNQFKKGYEKGKAYEEISKNPYLEFFDKYSNNILCNYFDLGKEENGVYVNGNETQIYRDKKLIKTYILDSDKEIETSRPDMHPDIFYISVNNQNTGEFYQARIVEEKIDQLIYSNLEGPVLIENYRKNEFYRGKNLRNALVYNGSQLNKFYKDVKEILKK